MAPDWGGIHIPDKIPDVDPDTARRAKEEAERVANELKNNPPQPPIIIGGGGFGSGGPPPEQSTKVRYYENIVDLMLRNLVSLSPFNVLNHVEHLKSIISLNQGRYQKHIDEDLYGENIDPHYIRIWDSAQGDLERYKCMTIGWALRGNGEHQWNDAPADVSENAGIVKCIRWFKSNRVIISML
jgi:hypothetical protein